MKKYTFLMIFLLTMLSLEGMAQKSSKITVSGTVTDADNRPVNDAMILIDNKETMVVTNEKGFYKIKVKSTVKTITVFSMQYGMADEPVNGRTEINFRLKGRGEPIPAAVQESDKVNVGYGTVDKKDMTTSVGQVDGTNPKYDSYPNIYEMIKGEVAGVQVSGKKITIQGVNSINSGTDPLLVVDGMAVGSIDDISPRMVKSIEVLKGPSASIYGSRGANGVILITLKGSR